MKKLTVIDRKVLGKDILLWLVKLTPSGSGKIQDVRTQFFRSQKL